MRYEIYDIDGKLIDSGEATNEPVILRDGPEEEGN
jgi:hypothetical protein